MYENSSARSTELFSVSVQSYPLLFISAGLVVQAGPAESTCCWSTFLYISR